MPRNCMVFLMRRELTLRAILWSQVFDTIKWLTVSVCKVRCYCVDRCILLKHLSNHMHFIINGFVDHSTNPRQRVPFNTKRSVYSFF